MGQDYLWGGQGKITGDAKGNDRYLVLVDEPNPGGAAINDRTMDFNAWNDARIKFANSPAVLNTPFAGQAGLYSFAAGNCTEADIQRMDVALGNLHQTTGNTRLLKTAAKGELGGFLAVGRQTAGWATILGWNGSGQIVIVDPAVQSDAALRETVYHEIGHNWDEADENRHVPAFRANSGWKQFTIAPTSGYTASFGVNSDGTDDNWYYLTSSAGGFARGYGKTNPNEDMCTTWEAYFTNRYHGGTTAVVSSGLVANAGKWATLDSLFADLNLLS